MLICFQGVDGSGKTLQAIELVHRLNAAGYPAVYVWCGSRTLFTRPFTRLAKRLLAGPHKSSAQQPRAEEARSHGRSYLRATQRILKPRLLRRLWLQFSLVEHAAKIWLTVVPHLLRRRIVVCDRYIYDSTITTAALAGLEAATLPELFHLGPTSWVPRPARIFFLDVPTEVAIRRKSNIADVQLLERRTRLYRAAAAGLGMEVIDATAPPEEIVGTISRSVQSLLPPLPQSPTLDAGAPHG